MATGRGHKIIPKSSVFKYVFKKEGERGFINYVAIIGGHTKSFDEERQAALWVDKYLINKGKESVNILVRK